MRQLFLWLVILRPSNGFQPFGIRIKRTNPVKGTVVHSKRGLSRIQENIITLQSRWIDDDDDEEGPPIPIDMRYSPPNIMRQHENFVAIREAGGAIVTHDLYARDPNSNTFWFCGKVAAVTDVPLETAVSRQWPLIEEHAIRLRPIELFSKRGLLELWCAPGDSELDVAYNRPTLRFMPMIRPATYDMAWRKTKTMEIGFQGEIYNEGEQGFRALRNNDGTPMKAEIIPPTEARAPTDDEMAKISELMKQKDMQDLFKQS